MVTLEHKTSGRTITVRLFREDRDDFTYMAHGTWYVLSKRDWRKIAVI